MIETLFNSYQERQNDDLFIVTRKKFVGCSCELEMLLSKWSAELEITSTLYSSFNMVF